MAKGDVLVRMKADVSNYDANIAKARKQLDSFIKDNMSFGGVMKQASSTIVATAGRFASLTAAVGALSVAIKGNIETAKGFEKSMSQLSSLTGMVGSDLQKLKNYAIELGSSTTLTASEVADAFKMIGSQQPQLLESGEALKAVTKQAITLAEAAGIDLATAAQTLSTSINQMGGDSSNAERYVNVLAAASQKGAGDIAWLGESITKAATAAKAVGTDYEELVANLEQLAKAGFDASTAGTALRSIIMNLEKQSNQNFKPSVVGLTQAFENLNKAQLDLTGYQTIAGKMFATQAKVLAEAAGEARNMKDAITGTNTAEEQAATNTANLDGSLKSLSSAWEGLNLHINDSNGFLRDCVDWLKDVVKWADQAFTAAGKAQKRLAELQGGSANGGEGETRVDRYIDNLKGAGSQKQDLYNRQLARIAAQEEQAWRKANQYREAYNRELKNSNADNLGALASYKKVYEEAERTANAWKAIGEEYKSKAKAILNPAKVAESAAGDVGGDEGGASGKKGSGKKGKGKTATIYAEGSIAWQEQEVARLTKMWKEAGDAVRDDYALQLSYAKQKLAEMTGGFNPNNVRPIADLTGSTPSPNFSSDWKKKNERWYDATAPVVTDKIEFSEGLQQRMKELQKGGKDVAASWRTAATAISSVGNAMSGLQNPAIDIMMVIGQAVATIGLAYADTLAKDSSSKSNIWSFIAAAAAATVSMATTIASLHNATGYAQGGIVKGNSYSGDNIYAGNDTMVNAGELILNRSQQLAVASQLQGNSPFGGGRLVGKLRGSDILISIERELAVTGKGQLATFK